MRLLLPILAVLPVLAQAAPGGSADDRTPYTRTVKKLYDVDPTGDVLLDNRYGDVDYRVWERDEVKVAVTITVDASSEDRAEETFDRIDIDFDASDDRVAVRTSIESSSGWSWFNWGGSNDDFEIDYQVYGPAGFDVEVHNRYGDVNLADLAGDAELEVRYGDLVAGDIAGDTRLTVAYGDASLGRIADLAAEVRYGELALERAGEVELDSRYSEMTFGSVGELTLDSRYDEFDIGTLGSLVNEGRYDEFAIDTLGSGEVETRYSDIRVGYLADAARMNLHYGDARIADTSPRVSVIDLHGNYADLQVRLAPELRYSLEARGNYTDIDLPGGLTIIRKEKSGNSESYRGRTGEDAGTASVVLVGSYGSIRVD